MTTDGNLALAMTAGATAEAPAPADGNGVFHFEHGLFGFPECRSFVLVPAPRDGFYWLQSTEHEALCLLVADPFPLFRGYSVDLPDLDAAELGVTAPDQVAVLVTVTLPDAPGRAGMANLQGPIILNTAGRRGRQVVLHRATWSVREPVYLG